MTNREAQTAKNLLGNRADRTETIGNEHGGVYLTAYWRDGGQTMFYTLDDVREWLQWKEGTESRDWHYTDGRRTLTVEAASESEAHDALAEIVARDFPDSSIDDWRDE